jgi:hypothetical protein
MKNTLIISCLLSILLHTSCVDEISTEVPYELNYIVYGSITNQKQKVRIEVYKSSLLLVKPELGEPQESPDGGSFSGNGKGTSIPINDAIITLYSQDNENNETIITNDFNVKKGIYTSEHKIEGKTGKTYWIEVLLNDGTKLISKKETLKEVVAIEKTEFETNDFVKVSFKDPKDARNLYLLESSFFFRGQLVKKTFEVSNDVLFDGSSKASMGIDVYGKPVADPPLDKLKIRLSNVNFSTYQFFLNLKKQYEENTNNSDENGEEQNSGNPDQLFAAPSVNLYGNIKNKNTGKKALGNFSVLAGSNIEF